MNKGVNYEGLEEVTDPEILRVFSPLLVDEQRWKYITRPFDEDDLIERDVNRVDRDIFFMDHPIEPEQPTFEPQPSCSWGRARIARFIKRYISIYTKRKDPNREFFLKQLEEVAAENHIKLPNPDELKPQSAASQKRLITGLVDENRTRVSTFKYYFDGSNYIAYIPKKIEPGSREVAPRTKWDELFDMLYPLIKERIKEKKKTFSEVQRVRDAIESELIMQFYTVYCYDDHTENEPCPVFISRKLYNKSAAYAERRRRFKRKSYQTKWTAWWTITYDDDKFGSGSEFKRVLLNKFRNLCFRCGWRIMGVFENGELGGRLHFHGFFYIPEGQEIGQIVQVTRYSTKRHCNEMYYENTEFARLFGINKYEDMSEAMAADVSALSNYMGKMNHYMDKGGIVYYSRHLPSEFIGEFAHNEMLMFYNITCKRPVKRFIVRPDILVRNNTSIFRTTPPWDPNNPYELGLLDGT